MGVKRTTKSALPKAPPISSSAPVTPTEAWYLECLSILSKHLKRPPKITELAHYCNRAVFPTWEALCRLETKGKVRRNDDRRFMIVEASA